MDEDDIRELIMERVDAIITEQGLASTVVAGSYNVPKENGDGRETRTRYAVHAGYGTLSVADDVKWDETIPKSPEIHFEKP